MQNHMYLARIPQGQERDYVRGLIHFIHNDGRKMKVFMSFVLFCIVFAMWSVSIQGIGRVINEGFSIFPVIVMFIFSIVFSIVVIMLVMGAHKFKNVTRLNNIRVWDVQIANIQYTTGYRVVYFATVMFADGTYSSTSYEMKFYPLQKYQHGLIIAVYDNNGKLIDFRLVPAMEYGTKSYKLAMKALNTQRNQ